MNKKNICYKYIDSMHKIGFVRDEADCRLWMLPSKLGRGYIRELALNDHYVILKSDFTPRTNLRQDYENDESFLEITSMESGDTSYHENGKTTSLNNTFLAYSCERTSGTVFYEPNTPIRFTTIVISESYYKDYLTQKFPYLEFDPIQAKHMLESKSHNLKLQLIFKQILDYESTGNSLSLFYESKVLELLSAITEPCCMDVCTEKVNSHDYEMVEQARTVLVSNLVDPPTIPELSKLLCVNTTKLKATFKQLCNSTIYGYIKTIRMERSLELLKQSEYTIRQIALQVGYQNPSKFTEAFKGYYGCTPKKIRQYLKMNY